MLAVRYASEIEDDLATAAAWYVAKRPELGEEFLRDYEGTAGLIAASGHSFRYVVRDYRRLQLKNFPYAIYFTVHGGNAVVYLVIHTRRDPALIDRLLDERR